MVHFIVTVRSLILFLYTKYGYIFSFERDGTSIEQYVNLVNA